MSSGPLESINDFAPAIEQKLKVWNQFRLQLAVYRQSLSIPVFVFVQHSIPKPAADHLVTQTMAVRTTTTFKQIYLRRV